MLQDGTWACPALPSPPLWPLRKEVEAEVEEGAAQAPGKQGSVLSAVALDGRK